MSIFPLDNAVCWCILSCTQGVDHEPRATDLDGGTLPPGTALPDSLLEIYLNGGTLPPGTTVNTSCRVYP